MKISVIIVLYKQSGEACAAFQHLLSAFAHAHARWPGLELSLYLWDNSPVASAPPQAPFPVHHHHDPGNGGLVPAYNWAWRHANEAGSSWLLLLDQDASIPEDYLDRFLRLVPFLPADIAAVVPRLYAGGRQISPLLVTLGIPMGGPAEGFAGASDREICAINAAAWIRVAHLAERGGYSSRYSLDAVDFWFFADVYAAGRRVFVLDCAFEHALSVADLQTLSPERWRSVLGAEISFYMDLRPRPIQLLMATMVWQRTNLFLGERRFRLAAMNARAAVRLGRHALLGF